MEKYSYLKKYVVEIIENHSSYGIRRIKQELLNTYGVEIGRDVLGKLLVMWGLQLKRKLSKKKKSFIQKILESLGDFSNLLKKIKLTAPFQSISSDITEIAYRGGKAYLCVHKDVYGQLVYGYKLSLNMDKSIVIDSYRKALKKINNMLGKIPEMICHSDQGSQYTSYAYVEEVQKYMGFIILS